MKKTVCFLLSCILSFSAFSQVIAIQNDKFRTLYIGINNELTIASEQCPYDSILVTCKNGTLVKGDQNHYNVIVDSPGVTYIELSRKTGKDYTLIDSRRYKIEYLPEPIPIYAKRKGGEIALSEIDEGYILIAKTPGFDRAAKYVIDSFTLMIVRDDKLVFIRKQPGGVKMDDAAVAFLKTLKVNDKILFTGITCKGADKRLLHLRALELLVTNKKPNNLIEEEKK